MKPNYSEFDASIRRDYGWHRCGWRWEVRLSWLNEAGAAVHSERVVPCLFWREHTAAAVSNAIFNAYEDGRSVQRARRRKADDGGACDGN